MDSWILEYAATFRKKGILACYANGNKLSSLGCPKMPLMCAFLSSAVEKEEYEYYEKAVDVLWELYKVIPHLIPFQEFGNLILDIKIQKISLTIRDMTDKNYSKLTEEVTRLFKVPEGRDFQNEEDVVWFNRKAKEISWKLIRYINDGNGNYEMLSSFSHDIKERVFEYVEKVNKKVGLTFLELFSRFSQHSHCKTKCELQKPVSHKSKKMKIPTESKGSSVAQTSATDENLLCSQPVRCNHGDIHDEPSYDTSCDNQCQLSTDNQLHKVPCLNYSSNELSSDTSEDLLVLYKATALQTNIQGNSSKLLCGTHSKQEDSSNLNKFNPGATASVTTENACAKSETNEPKSGSTVVVAAGVSRNIKISTQRTYQMISSQSDEESHTQSHCKRIKISHHESSTKGRMNAGNGEYSENFSESKLHRQCHKTSSPVAVADHMSSSTLLKSQQSISEKNPSVTQENIAIPRNLVPFKVKIEPQKPSTNPISQNKTSAKREASIIPGNESGLPAVPGNDDGKCTCDVYCQTSLASSESSDDELSSSLYSSTSEDTRVRPQANSPKLSRTLSWKDLQKLDPAGAVASVMAASARAKTEKEPKSESVEVQAPVLGKDIKNNPGRRNCQVVSSQSDKKNPTRWNRKKLTNFESFIVLGDPGHRLPLKGYESDESTDDRVIRNMKFRARNVLQESDELLSDTSNVRDSHRQLSSISDKTFTPNEKQDNEPGSITRKKVGFGCRNSENRDFKHKRNDHVSESSQPYSTTSDEDCFQELKKRCYVDLRSRRNRRRSSRVSLAMRNLQRISQIKRLGKIKLLDCVVVLEKVKMLNFLQ